MGSVTNFISNCSNPNCNNPSNTYNPECYITIHRKMACPDPSYCLNCDNVSSTKVIRNERYIQNFVGVNQSLRINELNSITTSSDYLNLSPNNSGIPRPSSREWSSINNLRNQSDRRIPHGMRFNYVPTRGNSLRSTVTSNRPGAMSSGGKGVDVKHNSYYRYLAKLKGQTISLGSNNGVVNEEPENTYYGTANVNNNKTRRFTLVNTSNCLCNGL